MVDNFERGIILDGIRWIFAKFDLFVYYVISFAYQIFYNVATANIITGTTLRNFYSRIQIILGIIVMFKVAISLFNGIMNPDSLKDAKNGMSGAIKRIVVVLILLVVLVPLNIPNSNASDISAGGQKSWNARMNENGILFGTIFELQSRILSENTISKLILGTAGNDLRDDSYQNAGDQLAFIIFKCFFTINLNEDSKDADPFNPEEDEMMCKEEDLEAYDQSYDSYYEATSVDTLLNEVNQYCDNENGYGGERYAYNYSFLFSTIVGVLFALVIISFTIDVAIRAFKLAILKLIAPMPIISYIDSKGDQMFNNWVKTTTTTFLDLFIRIAIINFMIFFIREFDSNGIGLTIEGVDPVVQVFSKLFVYLGLILFAKEAPKFITDTLGLKDSKGLFGGLAALAGFTSSTASGVKSMVKTLTNDSQEPTTARNKAKAIVSGLTAGFSGAHDAYYGYERAKDNKWRSAMDPVNRTNDTRLRNAELGAAWWNSPLEQIRQDFTGSSTYGRLQREIQGLKAQQEKLQDQYDTHKSRMDAVSGLQQYGIDEALKKGNGFFKFNGGDIDIKNFNSAIESAKAQGNSNVDFTDSNGRSLHMSLNDAINNLGNYSKEAGADYLIRHINDTTSGVQEKVTAANYGAAPGQEIVIDATTIASALNAEIGSLKGELNKNMTNVMYGFTDANNNYQKGISDVKKEIYTKTEESKKAYAAHAGNDNRPGGK